jgi:DNA-binding response OmpR family regulator
MILQALLVSKDDRAAEALIQVQTQLGVVVDRSNVSDVAMARLKEQHFDQVIVDFDDPEGAASLLQGCKQLAGPDSVPVPISSSSNPSLASRLKIHCAQRPHC